MRGRKLLARLQQGHLDNVGYADFVRLVEALGFVHLRTAGGHAIFGRTGIAERVVLQPIVGKAKPYQIRQLLAIVHRYNLSLDPGGAS